MRVMRPSTGQHYQNEVSDCTYSTTRGVDVCICTTEEHWAAFKRSGKREHMCLYLLFELRAATRSGMSPYICFLMAAGYQEG